MWSHTVFVPEYSGISALEREGVSKKEKIISKECVYFFKRILLHILSKKKFTFFLILLKDGA